MAAQPRLYRSSQPAIDFFSVSAVSSRCLLVGGKRREKLRWDQMHALRNQRRSLETGVSKQREEGENNLESIVERQKKKNSLRALEAEDARDLGQAAKKRNIRPGALKMIGLKRPPTNRRWQDKLHT